MKTKLLLLAIIICGITKAQGTWIPKANFPGGGRQWAISFSIGTKGYFGTGYNGSSNYNDFWEYDPSIDTWTQKANFPGAAVRGAACFSIGNKGYVGTGFNGGYTQQFWEYDQLTDTWTARANFGGPARYYATAFSIGTKGYIGLGYDNVTFKNDFWEWDQTTNTWTQKTNFPGVIRSGAKGFSILGKGYIGLGSNASLGQVYSDFYEYNPSSNAWTAKANFAGLARAHASSFVIGGNGYIGLGSNISGIGFNDFWIYSPTTNAWTSTAIFGGGVRSGAPCFSIGNSGYVGVGIKAGSYPLDFWEYTPMGTNLSPDARFTSSEPGCIGQSENFYSVMTTTVGVTHFWDFGMGATPATSVVDNPTSIVYSTSGAKLVSHIVTTSSGSDTVTNIITINPSPIASFTSSSPSVCEGASVNFTNIGSTSAGVTYSWDFGLGAFPSISSAQNPTGIIYSSAGLKTITQTVMNQFGCFTSTTQMITINALPIANAGKDTTICANTSVQIGSPIIAGMTYNWFPSSTLNSTNIANPTASPIAPLTHYFVAVTNNSTGCINHDSINITMLSPLLADAGIDGEICRNDSIQLGAGLIQGQNYSWSPSLGLSNAVFSNPIADIDSTTTYTLTVTGNGCQAVTDEVTVIVHPLPIANAGIDDSITTGASIQLNSSGGVQYNWFPEIGLNNTGIYNPIASLGATTEYVVTVTDIYGCVNSDSVKITVISPSFWLPTSFSPDGNGTNDIFYVRGEGIGDFEFSIFNRWGEQIFLSKSINNGWDGKRQISGEELPEGAYVYSVKGVLSNGEPINATGLVNLIR